MKMENELNKNVCIDIVAFVIIILTYKWMVAHQNGYGGRKLRATTSSWSDQSEREENKKKEYAPEATAIPHCLIRKHIFQFKLFHHNDFSPIKRK
eukprot:m.84729 g.84729  ORF g.84729 m.84729 type:complete len:95 (+) comp8716_c0_seq11:1490-1774(+)